ncbi:hypothetical protein ACFQ4K_00005 [Tistrella bauzanensis]
MDQTAIQTIVYATMRDPILWVLCIAIGWRLKRPLITLLWMLTAGGLFFGLFRGMIYRVAFNEPLEGGAFGIVVASALILTLAGGIAVHGLRMLAAGRGTSTTHDTGTGANGGTPASKAGPEAAATTVPAVAESRVALVRAARIGEALVRAGRRRDRG